MKNFWRILLILTLLLYVSLMITFTLFHKQFTHLALKDDTNASECILVYNPGNNKEMLQQAKKLLENNKESKLIYSPFVVNDDVNSLQLIQDVGIKKANVLPDYYSTSMKTAAINAGNIMQTERMKDCIIIGKDYEMKRLVATFEKNNPLFDFYHQAYKKDGKSYLETDAGKKAAEEELWQYPKLWLNR